MLNQSKIVPFTLNEVSEIIQLRDLSYDHTPTVEEIFEVANEPLITSIQYLLQKKTSEWQETLLNMIETEISERVLSGKKIK